MSNNDKSSDKAKFLQPVIIALTIAIISSASGILYRHETLIVEQTSELIVLKKRLYRFKMSMFEYHDRAIRFEIQSIELKQNKDGSLSIVDQTRMSYLTNMKEVLAEKRTAVVEEGKDSG